MDTSNGSQISVPGNGRNGPQRTLASVFAAAMTICFTIIRNRAGLQAGLTFGSTVLIHAFRVSSRLLSMQHYQRRSDFTMVIIMVYAWPLTLVACIAGTGGDKVAQGLGLGGGFFLFFCIWAVMAVS